MRGHQLLSVLRIGRTGGMLLAAIAVLAVAGSVAYATIPDSGGVIHGCYLKAIGSLRVIDPSAGQRCAGVEKAIQWNQTGPQGPQGTPGTNGAAGPAGPTGPAGPAGPTTALSVLHVTNQIVAPAGIAQVNATCPSGYMLTGGGAAISSGVQPDSNLVDSGPGLDFGQAVAAETWSVYYHVPTGGAAIMAIALCAQER